MMLTISHAERRTFGGIIVADAGERFTYTMTNTTTYAEICSVCEEPVKGGFEVFSYARLGVPQIEIDSTPDRNFNVCDWCNKTVCFRCSEHPESGSCNDCYRIMSVSIDDEEELKRAETTKTMDQEPKIIYEEPRGSELTADGKVKRVFELIKDRQVDIADFQGRIDSLSQKLVEIANDFQENMSTIDRAIMDVLHGAHDADAEEAG